MTKLQQLLTAPLVVLGLTHAGLDAWSQTFEPTGGSHVWNDDNNWGPIPPQPYPNSPGAAAVLPAPTAALSIELGQPITIGSLTITKPTLVTFDTTITAASPNGFMFDGGGTIATTDSTDGGGGLSVIAAPVTLNGPLIVTQGDDGILRFAGAISGNGDITVNRTTGGDEFVAFDSPNTYVGSTIVSGNTGTSFAVLRLNDPTAIPGGIDSTGGQSNITLTNSAILGLGSTDFKRGIGPGASQIQFLTPGSSGFAAFGGTRIVDLGGAGAPLSWTDAGFGDLTFGSLTATGTIDFKNPLNFGNGNRTIYVEDGSAPIDAILSAGITSTGAANNFTKLGAGTLSLKAGNAYTGSTQVRGGPLRLDHPQALPAGTNLTLRNAGILGLGVADYTATLGAGAGQLQFGPGNAGFAAYGGDRKVTLNGGAPLVWGTAVGSFNIASNFILSDEGADSLIEFTNSIDLNGVDRTLAGRDGTARIDSRISGTLSGAGGIIKTQPGTLELSAANTYTGNTQSNGGVLLLTNANSIPGGVNGGSTGNINLNGGVLGLGHGNFTAPLGTGSGAVQWTSGANGGFAAFGADRIVNLGGAGAQVVWGTGGFTTNNLILSWESADRLVEFVNPIDLNNGIRTLAGRDGSARIDSRISGVISGDGGIIKTQPGTLELSAANTYTDTTQTNAGVLLLTNANSIPGGINGGSAANIILNGGVLGLGNGNFTAPLGTGPGQVQFNAGVNTGFAAFGGHRIVNLGGAGAQVVWGQGNFATNNLILGWESADGLTEFVNAIDLNGGSRTLAGRDGLAEIDSRISGVISGTGSINKTQPGTLELTAANTYDGGTNINAGRLLINNTSGSGVGTGDVTVNANATLGGSGALGTLADGTNVTVNSGGHIAPGNSSGILTVNGDVSFLADSFLDTELAGVAAGTEFDRLVINGAALLDGTLQVALINDFAPVLGHTFAILSATGGVSGSFASAALPQLSSGLDWDIAYGANSVTLAVVEATVLAGDYNQNGVVDTADYVVWRNSFGQTGPNLPADGNGNGQIDDGDHSVWKSNFGASIGGSANSSIQTVPEPGTLTLIAALLALIARRRVKTA